MAKHTGNQYFCAVHYQESKMTIQARVLDGEPRWLLWYAQLLAAAYEMQA